MRDARRRLGLETPADKLGVRSILTIGLGEEGKEGVSKLEARKKRGEIIKVSPRATPLE